MTNNLKDTATRTPEQELAGLILACYPGMPPSAAQSLAGSPAFQEVVGFIKAWQQIHTSRHFNTDFVMVVLSGLILRIVDILNQVYFTKPAQKKACQQSAVGWVFPPDTNEGGGNDKRVI
jgi:hypothetical protein